MNKYLFLDIDGVLNHDEWFKSEYYRKHQENWQVSMFDPKCVERVNKILDTTGARLVISSSWRSMADLEKIFGSIGLPTTFWRTPHADCIYPDLDPIRDLDNDDIRYWRGSEIKYWLEHNAESPYTYCILDDDCDMLPHQMEHFIQTCGDKIYKPDLYINNEGSGLTEKVMNKAIDVLNGNTKKTDN